jgi:ATP-dependent helicase HrpA
VFDDPARIQAVHRSILSGLLTHVALRQGPNQYQAAGNRSLLLFPGSSLHRKGPGKKQSRWIMAAELVETSQLFARNAAAIDPHWILHLGPHLLRSSYSEPAWNAAAGRVLVLEKFLLQGLEIARKHTDYGKINPEHATELFIRGALLDPETPIPLRFFQLNRQTRQRVEESLTRIRHSHAHSLDECLYLFYAARIQKVSSLPDLFSFIEKKTASEPDFCVLQESDLTGDLSISHDRTLFPEKVTLQNTVLPVSYAYTPGEETDGATLQIPLPALSTLSPAQIQWAVPGLRAQQVQSLLQALPRSLRRQLAPLEPKITEILEAFRPGEAAFLESFAHFLSNRYRVPVSASDWPPEPLPAHLLPRVEIIDSSRRTVSSGRNWENLTLSASRHDHRSPAWRAAENRWHREPSSFWSFGDLPDSIFIEEIAGAPFHAHPGLEPHASAAQPRLYRDPAEAAIQTRKAIRILAKNLLSTPIASAERALLQCRTSASSQKASALSANKSFGSLSLTPTPDARRQIHSEHFGTRAAEMILESLCVWEPLLPLSQSRFLAFTDSAKRFFPALLERTLESTRQIVNLEKTLRGALKKYPGMDADLNRLLPADFPRQVPLEQFERIPRFLKAIQVRAERAHLRPAQDAQKAEQLRPFADWERKVPEAKRSSFRWLLEELRVSLFAQELGTAETVSVARLQRFGEF